MLPHDAPTLLCLGPYAILTLASVDRVQPMKGRAMKKHVTSLGALGWILCWACPVVLLVANAEGGTPLPTPRLESHRSLEETIQQRRSVRSFGETELSETQIAQLCWAAQGVTEPGKRLRASPSAGATYPL